MNQYAVGLDLGQASDFSAVVVLDVGDPPSEPVYHVRLAERIPLKTSYPQIVERTCHVVAGLKAINLGRIPPTIKLTFDGTGVGRPVWDLLKVRDELGGVDLLAVTITAGQAVTIDHGAREARVAKSALVGAVQVVLQQGRL